jgi:hypothetical protein
MLRFFTFILLLVLSLALACSTPSWFPIKKGPPHKAKMKELLDKEVIIIDREEYVKVLNPRASDGTNQPKYLYVPVEKYLSKRETFTVEALSKLEAKGESSVPSGKQSRSPEEKKIVPLSRAVSTVPDLKKKIVVAYFDDRTAPADESFGDWVAEKLAEELSLRSPRVLLVDYQMVKEFLEMRGIPLRDLEMSKTLHLLNAVFGIHALVLGQLSGPYVFATKGANDHDETASAIIRVEIKLVDTFSGRTVRNFSSNNPVFAAKARGSFSEEKAKVKAIDLVIRDLGRTLSRELDGMDWFCRVARVEGENIYLNAGRLTGLRVGDIMEFVQPDRVEEREEVKGKVQISALFGIDASMGRLIDGRKPDVNDILKPARSQGI